METKKSVIIFIHSANFPAVQTQNRNQACTYKYPWASWHVWLSEVSRICDEDQVLLVDPESHLYGAHHPAGHPRQPPRHLGHPLPHALLHVIHVGGLERRRLFGCWCPHCVSQIPSWMMEMEMLSPGSLSRSSGSASCRRPPPSLCWSTCRSWCCCCPGTCTASRYHSDVWRHLQYLWRYYRDRLASRSLLDSPPKNMSELMDLALPNLLTASELLELGPEDTGAGERLGLSMYNITIFNPSSRLPT